MAGASMKDIKLRIKSVESTMQITKAMELVASSKLRKAKERQERSRPYFMEMRNTLASIEASTRDFSSPYQKQREVKKRCLIMIAGDRGLAGGYNSNIIKAVTEKMQGEIPTCILPIGKRAEDLNPQPTDPAQRPLLRTLLSLGPRRWAGHRAWTECSGRPLVSAHLTEPPGLPHQT